jgi:hypothetical protein
MDFYGSMENSVHVTLVLVEYVVICGRSSFYHVSRFMRNAYSARSGHKVVIKVVTYLWRNCGFFCVGTRVLLICRDLEIVSENVENEHNRLLISTLNMMCSV